MVGAARVSLEGSVGRNLDDCPVTVTGMAMLEQWQQAVYSAWGAIAAHLNDEAEWRSDKPGIVPFPAYEKSAMSDRGHSILLKASCSSWEAMRNKTGEAVGQILGGDLFEQSERVIELGTGAVESLLKQVEAAECPNAIGTLSTQMPDVGGWRDGCYVELTLHTLPDICSVESTLTNSENQVICDTSGEDGLKEWERYLHDAIGRVMVGNRIERHANGGKGNTYDADLLTSDGRVMARVEYTLLTNKTAENWSNGGQGEGKTVNGRRGERLRLRWTACLSLCDSSGDIWDEPSRNKKARQDRWDSLAPLLFDAAHWAESQMGTAEGAAYAAS